MAAVRQASVTWNGDLPSGKGNVSGASSGAFKDLEVSWARRSEADANGITSPEELLAAAHASCYAMALSADLGEAGFTPDKISANGTVTFDIVGGKPTLTNLHLVVSAKVPKIDAKKFAEIANGTKAGCPISRALKVPITLDAKLE